VKIYITSDHGGFELKTSIQKFLAVSGAPIVDAGPKEYDPEDDYPDMVIAAMKKVTKDPANRGIVVCRNGVGVSIVANKVKGIRAVLSWNPEHAASSRSHNDTNVLALPADYISQETALEIVSAWMGTEFEKNEERHNRRLQKIADFEQIQE
jgi:ribose 5-phosphate isomerase B